MHSFSASCSTPKQLRLVLTQAPHQPYLQAHDSLAEAEGCHLPAPCAHCASSQVIDRLQAAAETSALLLGPVPYAGKQCLSLPQISVAKWGLRTGSISACPLRCSTFGTAHCSCLQMAGLSALGDCREQQ